MRTKFAILALAALVGAVGIAATRGGPPADGQAPAGRAEDEKAINEQSQALARAFERGDAKEVAGFWTSEGEYVDEDREPIHGRDALEKSYAGFFADRPELKVESRTESVRFLGADSALEEGTFTVHARNAPANTSRFSSLYVREGGKWRIALLKEWGDDASSRPSLEPLAWLVGTWESDGPEAKARVTYEWTETKAFLRSKFVITPKEGDAGPSIGTQVIGVDPAEVIIRSWTFDPDGGFGEATWTWGRGRWEIEAAGSLADGARTTALNLLTPSGGDAFTWRSVERTLDGDALADIDAIKVTRVPEGK